ncbi:MAG TPA: TolC family protein [Gemmataceae bacterium]|jgi:cobalt-zinc-cadmium efflux system outer membrane protein
MTRCRWGVVPLLLAAAAAAAPPAAPVLSLDVAVRFALENNPQLAVVRQQRGLAAAGVVLARTYPYNPAANTVLRRASGPDVTNHFPYQATVQLDIEVRGQRWERRAAAGAAVTRTEWEIADQEVATAVAVIRAYNAVVYRQQKLDILEETVRLNELVVGQGRRLLEAGKLRAADVILARTELDTARAQRGQGRAALAVARSELRLQLGTTDNAFAVVGELDRPLPTAPADAIVQYAVQVRPDVHARCAAVAEAEARLRLQVADRFGNPSVGPSYEFNETRDSFVGVSVSAPIPVFNTHRGEILQRQAELARARAEVRQTEIRIGQDVQAALARFVEARKWADEYPAEVLPDLRQAQRQMEQLFGQAEQGVDVLRVIDVQRNLLRAADAYLDARFEVSQAAADLAAAVGDPAVAVGACPPAAAPAEQLPGPRP